MSVRVGKGCMMGRACWIGPRPTSPPPPVRRRHQWGNTPACHAAQGPVPCPATPRHAMQAVPRRR